MKQRKYNKEKKIRKILLISSDIEMQKKIKSKKYTLINSMTPKELEKLFQINNGQISTTISTYTNVLEKHIVKKIVDIPNNINYYYSDFVDNNNKNKEIKKRRRRYKTLFSDKGFFINYEHLIEETKKKEEEKETKEKIIENLIPFVSKKKSVGEEKINGYKSFPLIEIGQKNLFNFIKISTNNEINDFNKTYNIDIKEKEKEKEKENNSLNSSYDSNIWSQVNFSKFKENPKKRRKILDVNYKLIYYCYKYLKRKRPLEIKSSFNAYYGFEFEESYLKKNKTIKENETSSQIKIKLKKCKSSKEVKVFAKNQNSSKKKKKDNLKENKSISKELNKKKRVKSVYIKHKQKKIYNNIKKVNSNNSKHSYINNNEIKNEPKIIKKLVQKFESLTSEKKYIINYKRLSQGADYKIKNNNNPVIKKTKTNKFQNSAQRKKRLNRVKSSTQNIMSKADTKISSSDNESSLNISSVQNKKIKKSLHKIKEINNNINNINCININRKYEKFRSYRKEIDFSKTKKIKLINPSKFKNENPEENKVKEIISSKKPKKTIEEPTRGKFINSLKKTINFEINDNEVNKDYNKQKIVFRNNQFSKTKMGKTKSLRIRKKDSFLKKINNIE